MTINKRLSNESLLLRIIKEYRVFNIWYADFMEYTLLY